MSSEEVLVGWLIVVCLMALGGFYAWRQLQYLRKPIDELAIDARESEYRRRQARRRLLGSGLMLFMAVQLACALLFLNDRAHRQAERAEARARARERGEAGGEATPEERSFAGFYGAYWMVFLLVLLSMVGLALVDLWATRRFAVAAHRQLREERREMIDRQIARLRQEKGERNGHG